LTDQLRLRRNPLRHRQPALERHKGSPPSPMPLAGSDTRVDFCAHIDRYLHSVFLIFFAKKFLGGRFLFFQNFTVVGREGGDAKKGGRLRIIQTVLLGAARTPARSSRISIPGIGHLAAVVSILHYLRQTSRKSCRSINRDLAADQSAPDNFVARHAGEPMHPLNGLGDMMDHCKRRRSSKPRRLSRMEPKRTRSAFAERWNAQLFRFDVGLPDYLSPLLGFIHDEFAEFIGRHRLRFDA
jgi:hypothetical protein